MFSRQKEDLHHPVAMRVTPSQHRKLWAQVEVETESEVTTLDEESTTSSPHNPPIHEMNPYGYLRNEFSETECDDSGKL